MMDKKSKEVFDEITVKDLNSLTDYDKAFLRARKSYLRPEQKLAYKDILDEPQEEPEVPHEAPKKK